MPAQSPPQQYTSVPFPIAGVNRRLAFAQQGSNFCADASNVVPFDPILSRSRGGSRPGFHSYGTVGDRSLMACEYRYPLGTPTPTWYSKIAIGCITSTTSSIYLDDGTGTWTGTAAAIGDRVYQACSFHGLLFYPTMKAATSTIGSLGYANLNSGSWGDVSVNVAILPYTTSADEDFIEPTSLGAFAGGTVAISSGVVTLTPDTGNPDDPSPVWPLWAGISGTLIVFNQDGSVTSCPVASRGSDTVITLSDLTINVTGPAVFSLESRFGVSYDAEGTHSIPPPGYCTLVQAWQDRIVMSGDVTDPLAIYFCASGDWRDWRFSATGGPGDAVALAANSDGGSTGDAVTALIPYSDSSLLIGMKSAIAILRGNPAAGGIVQTIVDGIGILSCSAWCRDDEGNIWFMSPFGLYRMDASGNEPVAVSREYLPRELLGIDVTVYDVWLAYDPSFGGLIINIVPISSGTPVWYLVDLRNVNRGEDGLRPAFWPLNYTTTTPSLCYRRPTFIGGSTVSAVLQVSAGAVKYWDTTVACPDNWYMDYGPWPTAEVGYSGMLRDVNFLAAASSGSVTISLRGAESPEQAFNASTFASQAFATPGFANNLWRPRMQQAWAIARIKNTSGATKAGFEDLRVRNTNLRPQRFPA